MQNDINTCEDTHAGFHRVNILLPDIPAFYSLIFTQEK